jgi:hypothetical protein
MITPRFLLAFLVLSTSAAALAFSACGGGTSSNLEILDCAWATSESNCWKTTIAAAEGCLPPESEVGVLSADGKTCTFKDDKVIAFDSAMTIPPPDRLSFTVKSGGTECLVKTDVTGTTTKRVKTSAGTFEQTSSGMNLVVTCPDGTEYSATNALDLTRCNPDGGAMDLNYLPGDAWAWSGNTVTYGFLAGPGNTTMHLFTCQQ